ncbi:hypothetical protein EC912_103234 [Luteibacter rhizovicinus]|uniref:Uncharacterized protein n=1 Tax=Luteibacter rhizovicinus TaxID=242606 RepID=A0A4V2W496_9GAMM|nr:hypothetical protein [Luteibacter rhizovicinus]TCV94749.1 hypothetical protein EC912_103234 [Luteibacter rhizovicinus]
MRGAVAFGLLMLSPLYAAAAQDGTAAPKPAVRSQVESARAAKAAQDAEIQKLQKRLDALETDGRSAEDKLRERDRIIAQLQAELNAASRPQGGK